MAGLRLHGGLDEFHSKILPVFEPPPKTLMFTIYAGNHDHETNWPTAMKMPETLDWYTTSRWKGSQCLDEIASFSRNPPISSPNSHGWSHLDIQVARNYG